MKSFVSIALFLAVAASASAAQRPAAVVHHPIACNAGAQRAFDRGLLDYYAYNPEGAEHAFYTAADLDAGCAMAWWGIALANAPNLNVPATDDRDAKAREAIQTAVRLDAAAKPVDRALIAAASARFDGDATAPLEKKLTTYRDALGAVARSYPADADVAALYAESTLNAFVGGSWPHPDTMTDAQRADYRAQGAALLPYFQKSIAAFPNHVGLLHFYIHTAQFASDSQAARAAALQLAALQLPAEDSHLTHMPGHTFFDLGMYQQALDVGRRSLAMDAADLAAAHPGYYSSTRYYHDHNTDFALYALTQTGHLDEAVRLARANDQHGFLARQLAAAGRWREVIAAPKSVPADTAQTYARAIAYAELGDAANARGTIAQLPAPERPYTEALYAAMRQTVDGEIAVAAHDDAVAFPLLSAASSSLTKAMSLASHEIPPLYFHSPHLALARVAARMGDTAAARAALQAELAVSPQSPSALALLATLPAH